MSLALRICGTGDPVLFIHGCPTSADVLAPIAHVAARTHRAIQIALPGYGTSPPLTAPWAIADLHAAIEAAVAPELASRPLAIVGFSGGVYHALALASRGILNVRQVISLAGLMALTPADREGFKGFAAALRQGVDLRDIAADRFLSPAFKATHSDAVRAVAAWLDAISPANLANELDAFAVAPDLDVEVAALDIPILARVGALDVAAPPGKSEAIVAAAKRGTLAIVPGAGHALMYEDFHATTASIVSALGALSRVLPK
ncbi:MAG: alpha/beta fold hydrolase [Polyangiaceae bacterium]